MPPFCGWHMFTYANTPDAPGRNSPRFRGPILGAWEKDSECHTATGGAHPQVGKTPAYRDTPCVRKLTGGTPKGVTCCTLAVYLGTLGESLCRDSHMGPPLYACTLLPNPRSHLPVEGGMPMEVPPSRLVDVHWENDSLAGDCKLRQGSSYRGSHLWLYMVPPTQGATVRKACWVPACLSYCCALSQDTVCKTWRGCL